ncbi:hypothetical protein V2E39_12735 [Chryseobacterium arthrosphaerae]|uniref:DUF6896 domain-containing protein n=1 Tax=Chryseobacterium arthrosphaerae TaxID=651561 RepID=A0ABU7R0B4_9FLAO|nr:hypothetical protein [Chryseobacterium arthrosphaerae]
MERSTHFLTIASIQDFPRLDYLINLPRHVQITLAFEASVNHLKEDYYKDLNENLPDFQIGMHATKPDIYICKLITEEEIITNQSFFVQCAKDYRKLGEELMSLFITKKKLKVDEDFLFLVLNQLKDRKNQSGKVGDWKYFLHGFHCHFQHIKTRQEIEVPIMFGKEFGDLDPYFFSLYIKSTPEYQPLPVTIIDNFDDGERILQVMLRLGLLERINSNLEHHTGLVIRDRNKIEVKIFKPDDDFEIPMPQSRLSRFFQFLKF